MGQCIEWALQRARAFMQAEFDAVVVENYGDVPFFKECVPAETIAALTACVLAVRAETGDLPVGVNVLRNDARAALGICATTGAGFLRVNVHTGAMLTDQGVIEGRAAETLRERARLCPDVQILADVHVKHGRPLGSESIEDAAMDTLRRGCADALILSGSATGVGADMGELEGVRERVGDAPLLIGSGLCEDNARELMAIADGALVASSLLDGEGMVDAERAKRLRGCVDAIRRS